jgi:phosphate/sulfate permease
VSYEIQILALAGLLSFWVGANNATITFGYMLGANPRSRGYLLAVFAAGIVAGHLLEGWRLKSSILGNLVQVADIQALVLTIFLSTLFVVVLGSGLGYPISFVQTFVGSAVGSALITRGSISAAAVFSYSIAWLVTPILAGILATVLYVTARRMTVKIGIISTMQVGLTLAGFASSGYISYMLGASAFALIAGPVSELPLTSFVVVGAAVAGGLTAGRRVTRNFSFMMAGLTPLAALASQTATALTVHLLTVLAIPSSLVHASLGWILGAPLTHRLSMTNRRLVLRTAYYWVLSPFLGAIAAMLIGSFIFNLL